MIEGYTDKMRADQTNMLKEQVCVCVERTNRSMDGWTDVGLDGLVGVQVHHIHIYAHSHARRSVLYRRYPETPPTHTNAYLHTHTPAGEIY